MRVSGRICSKGATFNTAAATPDWAAASVGAGVATLPFYNQIIGENVKIVII